MYFIYIVHSTQYSHTFVSVRFCFTKILMQYVTHQFLWLNTCSSYIQWTPVNMRSHATIIKFDFHSFIHSWYAFEVICAQLLCLDVRILRGFHYIFFNACLLVICLYCNNDNIVAQHWFMSISRYLNNECKHAYIVKI